MNWLKFAHAWPGGRGLAVLALTFGLALGAACTTPAETEDDQVSDQVIGKPPSAEEDPFFVKRMPGEAVEAAPSGSIGEDEPEVDAAGEEEGDRQVAARAPDSTEEPERSQDVMPQEEREQTTAAPKQPQCFSCVRICPAEASCEDAKDDVICGWGVHETSDEAKRMAKAECDATLDMARQMPVWSEIAGECPAATCR